MKDSEIIYLLEMHVEHLNTGTKDAQKRALLRAGKFLRKRGDRILEILGEREVTIVINKPDEKKIFGDFDKIKIWLKKI